MNSCFIKISLTVLLAVVFLVPGCGASDSSKTETAPANDPRLIGTWQQTSIGKEQVSGVVVKLIFAARTLTMDAPGCLIIGEYTAADGLLTYTVKTTQGERCAKTQKPGKSDSVRYTVTDSQLSLVPVLGGEENRTAYKRMAGDPLP